MLVDLLSPDNSNRSTGRYIGVPGVLKSLTPRSGDRTSSVPTKDLLLRSPRSDFPTFDPRPPFLPQTRSYTSPRPSSTRKLTYTLSVSVDRDSGGMSTLVHSALGVRLRNVPFPEDTVPLRRPCVLATPHPFGRAECAPPTYRTLTGLLRVNPGPTREETTIGNPVIVLDVYTCGYLENPRSRECGGSSGGSVGCPGVHRPSVLASRTPSRPFPCLTTNVKGRKGRPDRQCGDAKQPGSLAEGMYCGLY